MNNYVVTILEIHEQEVEIEADSMDEAIEFVREGDGVYGEGRFIETIDHSEWKVKKAP